jgi:hypothetical protein
MKQDLDHFEQSIASLSPSLQEEMRALRKYEAKIVELLEQAEIKAGFIQNPLGTLERLGVPVPPIIRRRLQNFDPASIAHLNKQAFVLPNGQTITPQLKIRFGKPDRGV